MNIESITERGRMLVVRVRNIERDFVYPTDKFSNYGQLVSEIQRSILFEERRNTRVNERKSRVLEGFGGRP